MTPGIFTDRKLFGISPLFNINWRWIILLTSLLKEMFFSTIMMLKIIWFDCKNVKPACKLVNAQSKDSITQVIQANCITLTPGTMSMDLQNNKILVHAISDEAMQGIYITPEIRK